MRASPCPRDTDASAGGRAGDFHAILSYLSIAVQFLLPSSLPSFPALAKRHLHVVCEYYVYLQLRTDMQNSNSQSGVGVKGFHLLPSAEEWGTDWAAVCAEC